MKYFLSFILLAISVSSICSQPATEAVRGVWLTNVDSEVLNSKQNIVDAVALCKELGFNSIFAVTWNKAMTTYPSKIMKELTGIEIDTTFAGRDPLKELIDEAHKYNIKVFAWFEFGFSSSYQQNGGIILQKKPEWAAKDINGNLAAKNGFEWMNGFHPDVQNFLLSLILEVVNNYQVDGIQGDDRLPAMPSLSGYDDYTISLYKSAHNGALPPADYKDTNWVNFRADILNRFMKRIYAEVKAVNINLIVSMAPSIYPWSKEEYLQDWISWLDSGIVDLVCPQVYRYKIEDYSSALNEIVANQISSNNLRKFYPGILLKVGKYQPEENYLREMLEANRKQNVAGEVFFFYEGVKKYNKFFKELYKEEVKFPELLK